MNVYIVEKIQHRESTIVGVYECEKQAVEVVKNEVKESDGVFDIQYYILPHVVELKYKVGQDINVGEGVDQIKGKLEGLKNHVCDMRKSTPNSYIAFNNILLSIEDKIDNIITPNARKCTFCDYSGKVFGIYLNNKEVDICGKCWAKI